MVGTPGVPVPVPGGTGASPLPIGVGGLLPGGVGAWVGSVRSETVLAKPLTGTDW